MPSSVLLFSFLSALAGAQQIGSLTPEVHPRLPSQRCTLAGGCVTVNTTIVLDSNSRWLHAVNSSESCAPSGTLSPTLCADADSCGQNCALEGVDYADYGVTTEGNAVRMNLFVTKNNQTTVASPRIYLLGEDEEDYELLQLVGREFTFDVDLSKSPCGTNGALYLSEMDRTGSRGPNNVAGATYGTGYCDAQCFVTNFLAGEANVNGSGSCCNEMDIWEANAAATAFTPHPCNVTGPYACTGSLCSQAGVCDKPGCDFNAYRQGATAFYGSGSNFTINTNLPFTVVTQFISSDNTTTGTLTSIRRLYVQNGTVIANPVSTYPSIPGSAISDSYCTAQKTAFGSSANEFARQGGTAGMGAALQRGMVLAMSVWEDAGSYMQWLDGTNPAGADRSTPGVARGPCPAEMGTPGYILEHARDTAVVFSDIKVGEIGSTFVGGG